MKENGSLVRDTAMGYRNELMEIHMRELERMISWMVLGDLSMPTVSNTSGCGQRENGDWVWDK